MPGMVGLQALELGMNESKVFSDVEIVKVKTRIEHQLIDMRPTKTIKFSASSRSLTDIVLNNRLLVSLWLRVPFKNRIPFLLTFAWIINCIIYSIYAAVYILMPKGGSGINITLTTLAIWINSLILLFLYLKIACKHPGPIGKDWKNWDGKSLPKPSPPKHAIIKASSNDAIDSESERLLSNDGNDSNSSHVHNKCNSHSNHSHDECKDDAKSREIVKQEAKKPKEMNGMQVFEFPPEFLQMLDSNKGFVMTVDKGTSLQDLAAQMSKDAKKRNMSDENRCDAKSEETMDSKRGIVRNTDPNSINYEFRALEYVNMNDVNMNIHEKNGLNKGKDGLDKDVLSGKYCLACGHYKPPRAHHCSKCQICVDRMDHHCVWLRACVGFANHRYFIQFLIYYVLLSLVQLCMYYISWFVFVFVFCLLNE